MTSLTITAMTQTETLSLCVCHAMKMAQKCSQTSMHKQFQIFSVKHFCYTHPSNSVDFVASRSPNLYCIIARAAYTWDLSVSVVAMSSALV